MNIISLMKDPYKYLIFLNAKSIKESEAKEIIYLKKLFKHRMHETLDLDTPKSFNQKIQWLKLYNRNPQYTNLVDKYEVKKYIEQKIGQGYTIPTLSVWNSIEDIDFNKLPDSFVLKCTHDSGGVIICQDKSRFNIKKAEAKLKRYLKRNFYITSREWPYKNVKPRIIAEPYMMDASGSELKDYKFMCFNGKVKCLFTCTDRYAQDGLKVTFFDTDWNRLPFERHYPSDPQFIEKPHSFKQMIDLSEKLSKNIPFVRVDFYEIDNKPYFGEMTFYPGSGMEEFTPRKWDDILGDWIELPEKQR